MKRIFPLGLITFGILLSFGALGQLYLNNRASSPTTVDLLKQLAGWGKTDSQSGDQAISGFTNLYRIYALEGMGQRHSYFQSKNLVIWLLLIQPLPTRHFNKPWRSTHEKIAYVGDDFVLSNSGCRPGGSLFL